MICFTFVPSSFVFFKSWTVIAIVQDFFYALRLISAI